MNGSTLQWGAVVAALGLLSGILGYGVNTHITVQRLVEDVGEMRTNAFKLLSEMETHIETNKQLVAANEARISEQERYVERMIELADERAELLQDILIKVDPNGIGRQFQRLRQRQQEIIREGHER